MRFQLDDTLAQESFNRKDAMFQRSLLKNLNEYAGEDMLKYFKLEYKSFQNSNTNVTEIRCCDNVIALVYETRTEFNHQEVVWVVFIDIFPKIKTFLKQIKPRDV